MTFDFKRCVGWMPMALASLLSNNAQGLNLFPEYCATNPRVGSVCFKTREQAEDYLRIDPSPGYGRATLEKETWNTPYGNGSNLWAKYSTPMIPWEYHEKTWYQGTHPYGPTTIYESCGGEGCSSEGELQAAIDDPRASIWVGSHFEDPPPGWKGTGIAERRGNVLVDRQRPDPDTRKILYEGGGVWFVSKKSQYWCPVNYKSYFPGTVQINVAAWPNTCSNSETGTIYGDFRQAEQCPVGNPCIPASGGKTANETDFEWQGLTFQRHYHSIRDYGVALGLGEGWSHTFGWRLHENSGNSYKVDVLSDRLTMEVFTRIGSTTVFRSLNRAGQILTRAGSVSSPSWTLYTGDGMTRHFDATGRLTAVRWADHPEQDVALDYCEVAEQHSGLCSAAGLLHKVTNARGRALVFTYAPIPQSALSAPARLLSVASDEGVRASYGYDALARLSTVTYPHDAPATVTRTYLYNETDHICKQADGSASPNCSYWDFPYHLTGILDERQVRFADYYYDDYGRVTRSVHDGGADLHTLTYLGDWKTQVTLASGGTREYEYSRPGEVFPKPKSVTQDGQTSTYTYYPDVRLKTHTSATGTLTEYLYDSTYLTAVIEAKGTPQQRRRETDWDTSVHRPVETRVRNAAGTLVERRTFAYNARGQLASTTITDPATSQTRTTTRHFCEAADVASPASHCPIVGMLKSVDGPRSDVSDLTTYLYYATTDLSGCAVGGPCHRKGDRWKTVNAAGHVTETVNYDADGRVLASRDANGVLTRWAYHPRGGVSQRRVEGTDPGQDAITRIDYDALGQVTRITQPDGAWMHYDYDDAHRLTAVEDSLGNRIEYALDAAGAKTAEHVKDAGGVLRRSLWRTYDALGRLAASNDAYWHETGFEYDGDGNVTTIADPLGHTTQQDYDPLGRLARTLQDAGGLDVETRYDYDALDRLVKVTDPKQLDTHYVYDAFGDLTQLDSPDTGVSHYTYDAGGNRITRTDARGVTATHTYDALGRMTSIVHPDASLDIEYFYDEPDASTGCVQSSPVGRLTRMTDASGATVYCYDRRGNLVRKTQHTGAETFSLGYHYDLADRLTGMDYPTGGPSITYSRDAQGRIDGVKINGADFVSSVEYAPFAGAASMTFQDGGTLVRDFDANGAVSAVESSALSLIYERDARGDVTAIADHAGYDYDALHRLKTMRDAAGGLQEAFTYDATGNRTAKTVGAVSKTYHYAATSHRLTSIGSNARSYDAMGNTLSADGRYFAYDDRQRLRRAGRSVLDPVLYTYNAKGERVKKQSSAINQTPGSELHYFLYDESGHLVMDQVLVVTKVECWETVDEASTQKVIDVSMDDDEAIVTCPPGTEPVPIYARKTSWIVWMDDLPVALLPGGRSLTGTQQIHTDALGTPRALVTPISQTVTWRWPIEGSAFGDHPAQTDPDGDGIEQSFGLRYPGQYFDPETGLHYNYFRDYEPGTGRYIESDPLGIFGDIATYSYAQNHPLRYIDPDGRKAVQKCDGANGRVVCDGNGGFKVEVCNKNRCTSACTWAHENQHVQDFQLFAPNKCRDKAEGESPYDPYDDYSGLEDKIECRGSAASIRCAADKLNDVGQCTDPSCKTELQSYIDQHDGIRRARKCDSLGF